MRTRTLAGSKVALVECPAEYLDPDTGEWVNTKISGLFVLDEYCPYEPSAYVWNSGWNVFPANADSHATVPIKVSETEGLHLFVTDSELEPQIDPQGYGRALRLEREMEFAAEREFA